MIALTESHDLRTGDVPWREADWKFRRSNAFPPEVDIAILGSGIMGAILAERLSDGNRRVALFDRRPPGCGSTAASTAQIMWAMDVPMVDLAHRIGEAEAVRRWKRVHTAVHDLAKRFDDLGIDAAKIERPTLYLAGSLLDEAGLTDEATMHVRHGLPSRVLSADQVAERYGIAPRAAILSDGNFEIDPVRTCHALLDRAVERGASLTYPVDIIALHPEEGAVVLEDAEGGTCRAREVVIATGYERARLFLPSAFSLLSTFAIATPPGVAPLWREKAMIWEASDPYLYIRTDRAGSSPAGRMSNRQTKWRAMRSSTARRGSSQPSSKPCWAMARSPSTANGRRPSALRRTVFPQLDDRLSCRMSGWPRAMPAMVFPLPASPPKSFIKNYRERLIPMANASAPIGSDPDPDYGLLLRQATSASDANQHRPSFNCTTSRRGLEISGLLNRIDIRITLTDFDILDRYSTSVF